MVREQNESATDSYGNGGPQRRAKPDEIDVRHVTRSRSAKLQRTQRQVLQQEESFLTS